MFVITKETFNGEYSAPDTKIVGVCETKDDAIAYIEKESGCNSEPDTWRKGGFRAGDIYKTAYHAIPAPLLK